MKGRYKEAMQFLKSSNIDDLEMLSALENGYTEGGFKGAIISQAKLLELRSKTQYCNPTDIATFYALAGENDKAMHWLERAYELRDPNLPYLLEPEWDALRNDPRFQELAKKMNLPCK
jgi:tetratricopeptide (TPR) repeat protein